MKSFFLIIITLVIVLPLSSIDQDIPILNIKSIAWTDEEIQFIKELNKKGSLSIASIISYSVYEPQADGTIRGFHYNIVNEFSKLLNIKLSILVVKNWDDFFFKEGESIERVKTDPNYAYTPELIDKVDLYVEGITDLPWREKLFDIIKFVPSRQLLVSREDEIVKEYSDLNNKICVMVRNTSMELNLEKIKKNNLINFKYIYVDDFDLMDKMVSEKKANFTVFDGVRAFVAVYKYKNLTINMPVSEIEMLGWAINKKNGILKSIIQKYLKYAEENGVFDKYWEKNYGITFVEFLKVLDYK